MPEGHLIHRYAADHGALFRGAPVAVSSPQGRVAGVERVDGKVMAATHAYGKHLFYGFDGGLLAHVHLGMQGRFVTSVADVIGNARLRIQRDDEVVHLIAPSRCEVLTDEERATLVARLGPDPLRPDADRERAFSAIASSSLPIGVLLLDQAVIAGLGNVLRAEILYALRIDPERPGSSLGRGDLDRLWDETVRTMTLARDRGRIITRVPPGVAPDDVDDVDEREGRFVYKQEHCRTCGTPVRTWTLGGRTAYACPSCQAA